VRIVKLPDGQLRVPLAVSDEDGDADGTETIGPDDPRYPEYWLIALTEEEHAARERADAIANVELLGRWSGHYEAQYGHRSP